MAVESVESVESADVLTVESFPARFGDAILLTYGPTGTPRPFRILIDAGLKSFGTKLGRRFADEKTVIDLLVVSHIDVDHIGGVVSLLRDASFADRLGGVWFNGYKHLDEFSDLLGPVDGERLTQQLVALASDRDRNVSWNSGWPWKQLSPGDGLPDRVGGAVVADGVPPRIALPGGATAIVLSPTPAKLAALLPTWRNVVETAGLTSIRATPEPPTTKRNDMLDAPRLRDLAAMRTPTDTAFANGSSIAFVFEYVDGPTTKRVLLGADAHPDVLVQSLRQLAAGVGSTGKFAVDLCKIPHHASSANVTTEFVTMLACPRWLVSTNGSRFHHPDREALARCIVHGGPQPTLLFNYASDIVLSFLADYPPATSGYVATLPPTANNGITVKL